MPKGEENLEGFVVGTVHEPGICEACHHKLRIGTRAALWNRTRQLYCIDCAKEGGASYEPPSLVVSLLIIGGLLATIALGWVK